MHAAAHKLERAGCIALPARRGPSVDARRNLHIAPVAAPEAPIRCALCELQPLGVRIPKPATPDERFVQVLLAHEHSLGARNCVGENIRYLVRDRFAFIGWERSTRERNLQHLTNNTRFLIPRWGRVPHLARHVLGLIARRIRSPPTTHVIKKPLTPARAFLSSHKNNSRRRALGPRKSAESQLSSTSANLPQKPYVKITSQKRPLIAASQKTKRP